jgi:hypothetical protein
MTTLQLSTRALIEEAGRLTSSNDPDVSEVVKNLNLLVDAINSEANLRDAVLPMVSHSLARAMGS